MLFTWSAGSGIFNANHVSLQGASNLIPARSVGRVHIPERPHRDMLVSSSSSAFEIKLAFFQKPPTDLLAARPKTAGAPRGAPASTLFAAWGPCAGVEDRGGAASTGREEPQSVVSNCGEASRATDSQMEGGGGGGGPRKNFCETDSILIWLGCRGGLVLKDSVFARPEGEDGRGGSRRAIP